MRALAGVTLLALTAVTPLPSQLPPAEWRAFTSRLDAYAAEDRVVGASALLIRDGRIVARHHYGHADRAARRRVDERTIFHWASITKTLTAVGIMQLRDRGKLSLDDPVTRWIPELRRVHDPYGMIDSVTIRMLLTHSAGFQGPTWPWGRGRAWEPFEPTEWSQLVAMMPYQELVFRPGSRWGYSNPGFVYLGRIIELASGDPWAVYVQKNIFAPLGLARSYVGATPYHLAADRSHGYTVAPDPVTGRDTLLDIGPDFDPGVTIPNSGWNAPLDDLATYALFLAGRLDRSPGAEPVLSRATLEEMWRPAFTLPEDDLHGRAFGLSFYLQPVEGATLVGHWGSQAGYRSFLYVNPANGSAVALVFNTTNDVAPAESSLRALLDSTFRLLH
ncbi:MAG TPA: serine hydrolase domain-containing protein [Gemmatimonadales bacterium]|nr:serine hydrolase domain-containing protein [Gemmatimonadales bacterium]